MYLFIVSDTNNPNNKITKLRQQKRAQTIIKKKKQAKLNEGEITIKKKEKKERKNAMKIYRNLDKFYYARRSSGWRKKKKKIAFSN